MPRYESENEAKSEPKSEAEIALAPLPLEQSLDAALEEYFAHMEGHEPKGVYAMVLEQIEAPLLRFIMKKVKDNQCKAATMLGLNRGTLRKKLRQYQILS